MSTDADIIDPSDPIFGDAPVCVRPPLFFAAPADLPLPEDVLLAAAEICRQINPANAPSENAVQAMGLHAPHIDPPLRIALLTSQWWGPEPRTLTVSFMETTSAALAEKILSHMNAWQCGIKFKLAAPGTRGDVRISRGPGGYFSYLGPTIHAIPSDQCTMNLEQFSLDTPDSEFFRVVRHETGHTLGCPHEQSRSAIVAKLDRQKTYAWARRTQGWSRQETDQQILTPIAEGGLMGTPPDVTSVMCYMFPGSITIDGQPIPGGDDINPSDQAFIQAHYPDAATPTPTPAPTPTPTPAPTPTPTPTPPAEGTIIIKAPVTMVNGKAYLPVMSLIPR